MEMNKRNGKVILESSVANSNFPTSPANPGAKILTTHGINSSIKMTKIARKKASTQIAREANSIACSFPSDTNFPDNIGTNAAVKAPSANKLRNKLGSLNETKKASETNPAPKKLAITISRTKPVHLLIRVNPPNVVIDFSNDIFVPISILLRIFY